MSEWFIFEFRPGEAIRERSKKERGGQETKRSGIFSGIYVVAQ
jgi:hypothetical protein